MKYRIVVEPDSWPTFSRRFVADVYRMHPDGGDSTFLATVGARTKAGAEKKARARIVELEAARQYREENTHRIEVET